MKHGLYVSLVAVKALGAQGWGLASVVCTEHVIDVGGGTAECYYYMKRAK